MKCPHCSQEIHVYLAIPDGAVRCRKATKARTSAELAAEAARRLAEGEGVIKPEFYFEDDGEVKR